MNAALAAIRWVLAVVFLLTGGFKLFTPRDKLLRRMVWANDFSAPQIKLIAAAELLGALGLALPPVVHVATWIAPASAIGLAAMMGGAAWVHIRRKEPAAPPIVLGVLAVLLAARLLAR